MEDKSTPEPSTPPPRFAEPTVTSRSRAKSTELEQAQIQATIDSAGTGPDSEAAHEREQHAKNVAHREHQKRVASPTYEQELPPSYGAWRGRRSPGVFQMRGTYLHRI